MGDPGRFRPPPGSPRRGSAFIADAVPALASRTDPARAGDRISATTSAVLIGARRPDPAWRRPLALCGVPVLLAGAAGVTSHRCAVPATSPPA